MTRRQALISIAGLPFVLSKEATLRELGGTYVFKHREKSLYVHIIAHNERAAWRKLYRRMGNESFKLHSFYPTFKGKQ